MDFKETVEYLYNATPQFQQIGAAAYKPGLDTTYTLDAAFGSPHKSFRTIHVAGTNGKGSVCHTIASVLQQQGYKVGLYTSPHLVDFRERIRINGEKIGEADVVDFVQRYIDKALGLFPSFFELTTIMAFDYFAREKVDFAVIETGLGGRLDTTNIISPLVSVITNISFDHIVQLGNSLTSIATEKAGIIKHGIPAIIGEADRPEVRSVFEQRAAEVGTGITFAQDLAYFTSAEHTDGGIVYTGTPFGTIVGELTGECQKKNTATIIATLLKLKDLGVEISSDAVRQGFATVNESTGLMGRWMKVAESPTVICDTGHNEGGWQYLSRTLDEYGDSLRMVIGFVSDKDVDHILAMMPKRATYYFTRASVPRAMAAELLAEKAASHGLRGNTYPTVADALAAAKADALAAAKADAQSAANAAANDASESASGRTQTIFVGGSTFVVADLLEALRPKI